MNDYRKAGGRRKRNRGREPVFFNFALNDGHFMSRPLFKPHQSLIGEIVRSIGRFNPRFAWIQFLFCQRDYNRLLLYTKSELEDYVRLANSPEYDEESSRHKKARKETSTQWYKLSAPRIKKIEQLLSKQTILLAINGMWVSSNDEEKYSTPQLWELPFSLCSDEIDRLRPFVYRDPRILRMLVERRMVKDISRSIYRYGRSREEPPSLILTPEDIPYFIHMASGPSARGLSKVRAAANLPIGGTLRARELMSDIGMTEKGPPPYTAAASPFLKLSPQQEMSLTKENVVDGTLTGRREAPVVAALRKVPILEEPLDEDEANRLSQIVSQNVRTFEIVYDHQEGALDDLRRNRSSSNPSIKDTAITTILLSSSESTGFDLESVYIPQLESIYGKLDYELLPDKRPKFVVEDLPGMFHL